MDVNTWKNGAFSNKFWIEMRNIVQYDKTTEKRTSLAFEATELMRMIDTYNSSNTYICILKVFNYSTYG